MRDWPVSAGSNLRGQDRKHFVVVPLDGAFRVKDMAPSIQAVKKAAAASNGAVGVGLVSMMGFEHTRNELSVSDQSCHQLRQPTITVSLKSLNETAHSVLFWA